MKHPLSSTTGLYTTLEVWPLSIFFHLKLKFKLFNVGLLNSVYTTNQFQNKFQKLSLLFTNAFLYSIFAISISMNFYLIFACRRCQIFLCFHFICLIINSLWMKIDKVYVLLIMGQQNIHDVNGENSAILDIWLGVVQRSWEQQSYA